jgi:hypothetical protein
VWLTLERVQASSFKRQRGEVLDHSRNVAHVFSTDLVWMAEKA